MALRGLIVPTLTLFDAAGELDPGRNARFVRDLAEARVDHLFVLGSIGEFPSISDDERARYLAAVIDSLPGRTDAWVGCGAPSTRQALRYAIAAEEAGAAALVAVAPYYLHPTPEAIDRYFRALRAAVKIPLFAYNIPSLVGYALEPARLHALGRDGVLAGVKDTAESILSVAAFLEEAPPGFAVFPGDDALAADAIARGAAGAVMGVANVVPELCRQLIAAALAGDPARAAERQGLVDRVVDVLHAGPFPAVDNFLAAELRGADVGYRSPYDPLSPEEEAAVRARLEPLRDALRPYLSR